MFESFEAEAPMLVWAFGLTVVIFLIADLGFLNKDAKKTTTKSALWQSVFWVSISVAYGLLILYYEEGDQKGHRALEYFSAYLTEKSLSMDNIFVILLILRYFHTDEKYYHKVLFWGIIGAVIFRAGFIFTGALLVQQFEWILYIFGAFLVYTGVKIFREKGGPKIDPDHHPLIRFLRRYFPIATKDTGSRFMLFKQGKLFITPLFLVLVLIESTDLIFAVDSIPAAFAITRDVFIIYTSNIFAVMGLRAMFFLLASILERFYLLQEGLSIILVFIGAKMLAEIFQWHLSIPISFIVIIGVLTGSIVLSLLIKPKEQPATDAE